MLTLEDTLWKYCQFRGSWCCVRTLCPGFGKHAPAGHADAPAAGTVTTSFVWDMHADVNNATMTEGMGYVGVPFDHAVSALIEDIEARGLRDKILVVCCGEMGRAPRINATG